MLYAVILAGGGGTRLWPESRKKRPKPFLSINGQTTLLEETLNRLNPLIPADRTFILAGEEMKPLLSEALPGFSEEQFLPEPFGRNTAAAVALAACVLARKDPDAVMALLPSDHVIRPKEKFQAILAEAEDLILQDKNRLVTLGIEPDHPNTGFGYIHAGELILEESILTAGESVPAAAYRTESFHEKPNAETARQYLDEGGYYWNSGIFIWPAARIIHLMQRLCPEIIEPVRTALVDSFDAEKLRRAYEAIPAKSIDYAVMEKAENVVMIAASLDWNDLGTFSAMNRFSLQKQDADGNRADGIRLAALDAHNNDVRWNCSGTDSDAERDNIEEKAEEPLLAIVGLDNLEIVRSGNILLIVPKNADTRIGELVQQLKKDGKTSYL